METTETVYLVERTYSDDELNLLILTYATADGRATYRRERAIPLIGTGELSIAETVTVDTRELSPVTDPDRREWYREVAREVRENGIES